MKTQEKNKFYEMLRSGEFAAMVKETTKGETINNQYELYNVLKPLMSQEPDVEQCWMVLLDSKNAIIELVCMSRGSISSASVYPREIIKKVLSAGAAAVILSHNHPSGNVTPSEEDIRLTREVHYALSSIGVTLHDHIIIGSGGSYYSMVEVGLIGTFRKQYNTFMKG